ncbi:hypothetical protein E2542_SST04146 [Spatholobus suberectus]|nr:hypothetical protein E2542_SST04146 [Spatholobus suberectus]
MKNSKHLEDEDDLTLSLCSWFDRPKRARQSSPSPSTSRSPINPSQTNISLMETQIPYPNSFLVPSTNHNTNPLSVNTHPLLVSSSDHNTNPGDAADVGVNVAAPAVRRSRRAPSQGPAQGKSETVPAPFPWATNRRATVHSRKYLLQNNIFTITGKVHCKSVAVPSIWSVAA